MPRLLGTPGVRKLGVNPGRYAALVRVTNECGRERDDLHFDMLGAEI